MVRLFLPLGERGRGGRRCKRRRGEEGIEGIESEWERGGEERRITGKRKKTHPQMKCTSSLHHTKAPQSPRFQVLASDWLFLDIAQDQIRMYVLYF